MSLIFNASVPQLCSRKGQVHVGAVPLPPKENSPTLLMYFNLFTKTISFYYFWLTLVAILRQASVTLSCCVASNVTKLICTGHHSVIGVTESHLPAIAMHCMDQGILNGMKQGMHFHHPF